MLNYSPNVEKGYVSIKPVPGKLLSLTRGSKLSPNTRRSLKKRE